MSIRAYRIIRKELADDSSFNLWHDSSLMEFFQENGTPGQYAEMLTNEGIGIIEISVPLLEQALRDFKWDDNEDYRKKSIANDIQWAFDNEQYHVAYECF